MSNSTSELVADPSAVGQTAGAAGAAPPPAAVLAAPAEHVSPGRRAWRRFKRNKLGFWSLVIFSILLVLSLLAEVISNDKPLVVRYNGQLYFPMVQSYPETTFGGDFETETDFLDPFIREQLSKGDNWTLYAPNPYGSKTLNYFAKEPNPSRPTRDNLLGTDDRGRDMLAQLIYGFRLSVLFGLALTAVGVVIGVITGAIQGYFAGKTDLAFQRFIEIWDSMPELYLLIIFSAIFAPSVSLLLILLSLFGWMGLSQYMRAEFLRNRQMDYVRAARALGVGNGRIMWKHILPNSMHQAATPSTAKPAARAATAAPALAFFDKHAFETLVVLADQIVPGARAAKVPEFLDRLLAVESQATQKRVVSAIGAFEREARQAHGRPWKALTAAQATALLTKISTAPADEAIRGAFETIKGGVAETYFSSQAGMKELGWTGGVMFAAPAACGPASA